MINTLFDYFKSKGQALPGVSQRALMFGLGSNYTGTADQNNQLLAKLQGGQQQQAQASAPMPNSMGGQAPTPMAQAPTPAPVAPPQEDYLKQYLATLTPTADETNVQSQLSQAEADANQYDISTRKGIAGLEGRGVGMPLALVRGQQAKLEQQANLEKQGQQITQQTLRQKLANLQSQRKSAIDVSRFALDRADSAAKTASDRLYEEQKLAKAAAEKDNAPYTLSQGQTRYDARGNVLSALAPKTTTTKSTSTKGKTIKSGSLVYTPQMASEDSQELESSRGSDGYVDPTIYQNLYKAWIASGGSQKEFLSTYPPKGYVNPANKWLPTYLMPTAAKKTASTSSSKRTI